MRKLILGSICTVALLGGCESVSTEPTIDYLWVYQQTQKQNPKFIDRCERAADKTRDKGLTEKEADNNDTYDWGIPLNVDDDYDFNYHKKENKVSVQGTCWVTGYNQENAFRKIEFENKIFTENYTLKIQNRDIK